MRSLEMSLPVCLMIAGLIGCGQDDADEKSDPDISDTDGDSGAGGDSGDPGEFTDEDRDGFT